MECSHCVFGQGVPPATVAEFTLGVAGGAPDNYDGKPLPSRPENERAAHVPIRPTVSLVDGYNLPVAVTNSVGCPEASCPVDLAPNCKLGLLFTRPFTDLIRTAC